MPKRGGNKPDWIGKLRPFLLQPPLTQPGPAKRSTPITTIDEQTLDRILTQVGQKFVPADLDRTALRIAIAKAVATKEKVDTSRPGKRSSVVRKGVQRIRQAAETLNARLKENNDAWQWIAELMPPGSEELIIRFICAAEAVEQTLGESDQRIVSKYSPRIPTASEWLAGVELPLVFEKFFRRKEGRSRSGGKPSGPTVRFVNAVMTEVDTPFSEESIVRAMTRLDEIRDRRRAFLTLGKTDGK
jgi:hypothetical protein